jgi:hypothetical protein
MEKSLEKMRAEYRKLRQMSYRSLNKFDLEVEGLAEELADGEEKLPEHWLSAARRVLAMEGVK